VHAGSGATGRPTRTQSPLNPAAILGFLRSLARPPRLFPKCPQDLASLSVLGHDRSVHGGTDRSGVELRRSRRALRTACQHRTVAACDPSRHGHGSHDGAGPVAGTGRTIPVQVRSIGVRFTGYSFGSVRVDGITYDHDLIIDRGKIRKRKKAASKRFRGAYRHTPLSIAEDIPWRCRRLVIGTGADGAAGDEAGPGRGPPPQGRPCRPAHGRGDRHASRGHQGHQRRPVRDVLNQLTHHRHSPWQRRGRRRSGLHLPPSRLRPSAASPAVSLDSRSHK
jgi:hypothetical protein